MVFFEERRQRVGLVASDPVSGGHYRIITVYSIIALRLPICYGRCAACRGETDERLKKYWDDFFHEWKFP